MGIKLLPSDAIRTFGASQALTDPVAVVKELLDNSYDAKATSIAIEIASNTIDSIQARDNGHGIPDSDRDLVARPHCTSKIAEHGDLEDIGGSSLGFRGEALTSVAELSGSLTISTRVEGDPVAIALKINRLGEVHARERASLPMGTTVKITDFCSANPVRKQVLLKNVEKALKTLKQLMQAYAFARPHVRLSLKVLKSKSNKWDWTYAPKAANSAEAPATDLAFKIVGAAVASQCTWSVMEDHGFEIQALLPKVDSDPAKISNIGGFVSIDARPVSASRGTSKQIVKQFRDRLKLVHQTADAIKDPFIYIKISCPTASYDANIEPAKDDVLFCDADSVVSIAKKLFEAVYASKAPVAINPESSNLPSSTEEAETVEASHAVRQDDATVNSGRAFRSNMYGCDEEDLDLIDDRPSTGRTEADIEEIRQAGKDIRLSNPWVMAKLNASAKPQEPAPDETLTKGTNREGSGLPTPRPSSPSMPNSSFHPSEHIPSGRLTRDGRMIRSTLPQPETVMTPRTPAPDGYEDDIPAPHPRQSVNYDYTLSSQADDRTYGTSLQDIPDARSRNAAPARARQQAWSGNDAGGRRSKPRLSRQNFRPPRDTAGLVMQGEMDDRSEEPRWLSPASRNRDMRDFITFRESPADDSLASMIESRNYPQQRRTGNVDSGPAVSADDFTESMATRGISGARGFIPASEIAALEAHLGSVKNDGRASKRRRTEDGQVLREISTNTAGAQQEDTDAPASNANRTASRRRSSMAGGKVRRIKSAQLPLERTPDGQCVQNIVLPISITLLEVDCVARKIDGNLSIPKWEGQPVEICHVYDAFAVPPDTETIQLWAATLRDQLISRVSDGEMAQDLGKLIQEAFDAREQYREAI